MKANNILQHISLGLLLFIVACSKEIPIDDLSKGTQLPNGMVNLELFTNSDVYQQPTTRKGMAEEELVDSKPWVFVFRGNDDNATFFEARQATVIEGRSYVALTMTSSVSRLLVIANTPSHFFDGTNSVPFTYEGLASKLTVNSTTFATAVNEILQTEPLNTPRQTTVPYAHGGLPIPMTADLILNNITPNTTIGQANNRLMLERIVAKVTVSNHAPGFKLHGAGTAQVPRNGRFYQIDGAFKNNSGSVTNYLTIAGGVSGIAAASQGTENNTNANPIYIYESRKEDESSLIIAGTFEGGYYYYRLGFVNNNMEEIDVLRNKYYEFKINSVKGKGYRTVEEATTAPFSNLIDYNIVVSDQISYDIVDNGQYYLGVSNSECYVYCLSTGFVVNQSVVTVSTNAPASTSTSVTTSGAGFNLSDLNLKINTGGSPSFTDIQIVIAGNFSSGLITINVGNLTKTVKVSRKLILEAAGATECINSNCVSAEVTDGASWLSLSTVNNQETGTDKVESKNGTIYLFATDNITTSSTLRTGVVYISRSTSEGRLKLCVNQYYFIMGNYFEPTTKKSYVGTFHRWDQTGERVICNPNYNEFILARGPWMARVVAGQDFIKLDKEGSGRTLPYEDDPEDNQIIGNRTSVCGSISSTNGAPIYFRVGMKSKLPSASSPPRYGLIEVYYHGTETGGALKIHYIYVRQGEQYDYLNPDGPKWSPFNGKGLMAREYTDYPTQAGDMYQCERKYPYPPIGLERPSDWPITLPEKSFLCPVGYGLPGGGIYGSLNRPIDNKTLSSIVGIYADGYFDRRVITNAVGGDDFNIFTGTVNRNSNDIAYNGRLFYNKTTKASIFLPASGFRGSSGLLFSQAQNALYWTTSEIHAEVPSSYTIGFNTIFQNQSIDRYIYNHTNAMSVRCIKNN